MAQLADSLDRSRVPYRPRGNIRSSRIVTSTISVLGLVVLLNIYAPGEHSSGVRILASILLLLSGMPSLVWLSKRGRSLPLLPVIAGLFGLYYASPIFLRVEATRHLYIPQHVPDEATVVALSLSIAGLVALITGYYLAGRRDRGRRLNLNTSWLDQDPAFWGYVLSSIGLISYVVELTTSTLSASAQLLSMLSSFTILGALLLFFAWHHRKVGIAGLVFLWGVLIPVRTLLGFGTGANYQGVEILLVLGVAWATLRHRIPWKGAFLALTLLLILQPVKLAFRAVAWEGDRPTANPITNTVTYFTTAKEVLSDGLDPKLAVDEFSSRYGYLYTFSEVVERTPESVPYWGGATYTPLFTKLIPRFLLPEKPLEDTGQQFGHRYDFINDSDRTTAYNLPQLIELFANFGRAGVVIGSFVIGFIYRVLQRYVGSSTTSIGKSAASLYILSALFIVEGAFSQVFADGIYRVLALVTLGWLASHLFSGRRTQQA